MESIRELCRRYGVTRLEVFGSAANDTFDASRSNIDFEEDYLCGIKPLIGLKV